MATSCVQMTQVEKDAYVLANPTHSVIGPYSSETECSTVCAELTGTGTDISGGGLLLGCCANELPVVIQVTVITTLCNVTVPATWDADIEAYVADLSVCLCLGGQLKIVCQEGAWYLTGSLNYGPGSLESCDPLQITFGPPGSLGGCGGGFVVVTE